jgi:hypothetical protein
MKRYVLVPDPEPLVKMAVYVYPKVRQQIREQAAFRGLSMSNYLLALALDDREEILKEADREYPEGQDARDLPHLPLSD